MDYNKLYGGFADTAYHQRRFAFLGERFKEVTGRGCELFVSSPGRAEVLGNHTDHNRGKVIVAAIGKDILAAVSKNSENAVRISSEGFPEIVVPLNDLELRPQEFGSSAALVRGVARGIRDKGYAFGGFTACMTSDIFKGAGISSSAAFELLIAECINEIYLNGKLNPLEKAAISQYAENVYFDKPCGLLDQAGIALGGLNGLDFKEPWKPQTEMLPPLKGYSFVITNTGGSHASLTPHYALIASDMKEVARFFKKEFLREVEDREFYDNIYLLKEELSGRAINRAIHFFEENKRVDTAKAALKDGDAAAFLACVEKSGISSISALQNCHVPGDALQPLALALEYSKNIIKDGAVRLHGGGFAGTILAVLKDGEIQSYMDKMKKFFGNNAVFLAEVREKGACVVNLF